MHSNSVPCNNNQQEMEFDDDDDLNDQNSVQNEEVSPNVEATEFYDTLNATQQPRQSANRNTSNMSAAAITMLNLKSKHNMSRDCFDDLMKFMRESSHAKNEIPSNSRVTTRTLEPTKMSRKKKYAQTHAPLIIPPDTVQATKPPPPPPPRKKPQTKFNRLQPTKPLTRLQLRSQSQLSQPQLPLQPQPSESRPQTQIRLQPQPTRPPPRSQLQPQHTLPPSLSQPQPIPNTSQTIPTEVLQLQESPVVNGTPSSSSHFSEESNVNKFPILPEGDGFDQHKLVVKAIALIICTNLEEGKPSWKQLSKKQRDSWFDIFKDKFEQRKLELSSKLVSVRMEVIWVDSVGKKKGRIFGLGSVSKTLATPVQLSSNSEDVSTLRSQIHALNETLQKQEQEKLEMKQELSETRKQVVALMQHLGFSGSSHPHLSPQHSNDIDGDHME
ncbi:hypothetical protein TSUD_350730 [Trifolium subterraneum]|uniref:Uncharacterized protein n=1 Tax=Trifolium subterraneum TaxID=3900 RepID=A0A2Z6NQF3_TRISU|nr:hypothetical protein TSUD_350730 [Trifolium subterraneum]